MKTAIFTLAVLMLTLDAVSSQACRSRDRFRKCKQHYSNSLRYPSYLRRQCAKDFVYRSCPHLCFLCEENENKKPCARDPRWCNNNQLNCLMRTIREFCPRACNVPCTPTNPLPPQPRTQPPQPRTQPPQPRTRPPQPRTPPPQPRTQPPQPRTQPSQPRTRPPQPRTQPPQPRTRPPQPRTQPPQPRTQPPQPKTQPPQPRTQPLAPKETPVQTRFPGICADKQAFCFSMLFTASKCDSYGVDCPKTCEICINAPFPDQCYYMRDLATNCGSPARNCNDSNLEQRTRNRQKCAKTCCSKGQLY